MRQKLPAIGKRDWCSCSKVLLNGPHKVWKGASVCSTSVIKPEKSLPKMKMKIEALKMNVH